MPPSIQVREIQVDVREPGFRVESFVVVTTLMDPERYTAHQISQLYHARWMAELDLKAIKTTLGMDVLRCKSPEMVRREIWTSLLAYNLIRRTMLQSARNAGRSPRELSFAAAMETIGSCWMILVTEDQGKATRVVMAELENLAGHRVGNRPGRVEPRAVKRRPKPHPLLSKPRAEARAELVGASKS